MYLYEKNTRSVTYTDFINKELVLFSNCDNERSIPSIVDGFKPGRSELDPACLHQVKFNQMLMNNQLFHLDNFSHNKVLGSPSFQCLTG